MEFIVKWVVTGSRMATLESRNGFVSNRAERPELELLDAANSVTTHATMSGPMPDVPSQDFPLMLKSEHSVSTDRKLSL